MAKYSVTHALGAIVLLASTSCQITGDRAEEAPQVARGSGGPHSGIGMLDDEKIEIPGVAQRVQLHRGTGEFQNAAGSSKGRVTLIEDSQRVWRSQSRTDLITVMTIDNGGSGTFYHVAVYSLKDGAVDLDDSALLGDRIRITSVGIGELVHDQRADYRITIRMLERGEGASMASEPNIPSTRIFYVTNGELEAASPIKGDT